MRVARATLITTIVASALVVVIAYLMRPRPEWGVDDAGAIQGYALSALACSLALANAALLFPLVALQLQKAQVFTRRRWSRRVMAGVLVMSLLWSAAAMLFVVGGGLVEILAFTVLLSIFSILLLAPMSALWLWIAQAPKENSANVRNVA